MRNKWEERARDLDAPATITEREWRSLRRRAATSVVALILALVSTGILGYTLVARDGRLDLSALRHMLGSAPEPTGARAVDANVAGPLGAGTASDSSSATSGASAPDSGGAPVHAGW